MATEHRIDLAAGTEERREVPDSAVPRPDPAIAEGLRCREAALGRLRALDSPVIADVLTLLGY